MGSIGNVPILLGITIIFLAVFYRFAALLITILKNSKCTLKETAKIIKIEEKTVSYKKLKQSMKTIVYTPIYQYVVNGNFYTFRGATEETIQKKLGDEEYVFYDPSKPSRIIRPKDNIFKIILGFMIWVLFGLSIILYGVIINL